MPYPENAELTFQRQSRLIQTAIPTYKAFNPPGSSLSDGSGDQPFDDPTATDSSWNKITSEPDTLGDSSADPSSLQNETLDGSSEQDKLPTGDEELRNTRSGSEPGSDVDIDGTSTSTDTGGEMIDSYNGQLEEESDTDGTELSEDSDDLDGGSVDTGADIKVSSVDSSESDFGSSESGEGHNSTD
ncbi:hypothetical protein VKT23_008669 [Stygiomarasmius scandens]|uniref:Uncharacterized protein n=1 Tax=Marasmiellus scandens TaxID=2682957 RepID=A0ABR1JI75_9AGAR